MSIFQFADLKYAKSFDPGEEVRLGSLQPAENGILSKIRVFVFIRDFTVLNGSETLTMKIYTDSDLQNTYMTSDVFNLSDVTFDTSDPLKNNFLGYFRFDFSTPRWRNKNFKYYPTITVANNDPQTDASYISVLYDHPDSIYSLNENDEFFEKPIQMQVFTLQLRQT